MLHDIHVPHPIRAALVAATLDCLPHLAKRVRPTAYTYVHIALGAAPEEAATLLVRFRAAKAVLADARWNVWRDVMRRSSFDVRQRLDDLVIELIATLPLDAGLRFDVECFFAALLAEAAVSLHDNDNRPH